MSERFRWKDALPYGVMVILALIEPLTHLWILHGAPPDSVPTGVHTGDSSHHLVAMESFATGFASPFATCKAEAGPRDFGYFSVPIFLLYGLLGEFGRMLGVAPFLFLGLANGLGGFLLLWNVYRFFQRVAPREATLAFYLYALAGGVGGLVFLGAWAQGAHRDPAFEVWFYRFAQYELIEGQHLAPALLMPRFYYTLPLALGFAALTALVETDRCRCPGHLFFTGFLLFVTAVLNLRLGPLFWALGGLYLAAGSKNEGAFRLKLMVATALPVVAGSAIFISLLWQHPSYGVNVADITPNCVLLLPLLFGTVFHWPAVAVAVGRVRAGMPAPILHCLTALGAYLLGYVTLYLGHQLWFGNIWAGGDMNAAVWASDGALVTLLPLYFLIRRCVGPPQGDLPESPHCWIALWFLGVLVVSLLALGQGWFLRFSPQRLMVLMGVPLALMTAVGLQQMKGGWRRVWLVLLLGGGVLSNTVAALWFQGPLGHEPGKGPFAWLHYEYMAKADAQLIRHLPPGTVAVPAWSPIAFGEVLVHQGDYQILGGPGAMNLGDQRLGPLQEAVNQFFSLEGTDATRQAFVTEWCVDYIYCPATCPVDGGVVAEFVAADWLVPIATDGNGAVFLVDRAQF